MGDRQAKDALFDAFGDVAKALGNGRRAQLIDVLSQGERNVDELAREIDQSVELVLAPRGLLGSDGSLEAPLHALCRRLADAPRRP